MRRPYSFARGSHVPSSTINRIMDEATGLVRATGAPSDARAFTGEDGRSWTTVDAGLADGASVACPVFLPERRGLDDIHRHAALLPVQLVTPVTRAVQAAADRLAQHSPTPDLEPERIVPGSLGIHRRAV